MEIVHDIADFPAAHRGGIITIGNFDGVHVGHQAILQRVTERAASRKCSSIVLTFDPHPSHVLAPAQQLSLLQSPETKLEHLRRAGIDCVIMQQFSTAFAQRSAQDFVQNLHTHIAPQGMIIGYDLTFGKQRTGNLETLRSYCQEHEAHFEGVDPIFVGEVLISSSYVRRCLREGDVRAAAQALGRAHVVTGDVHTGHGIGRTLGYPTINMAADPVLIPAHGSYITSIQWNNDERWHAAATYIGTRPSFEGTQQVLETYVLHDEPPKALERCAVQFHEFVRTEQRFDSPEALQTAIRSDVESAVAFHRSSA